MIFRDIDPKTSFRILDKTIRRNNQLGKWTSPPLTEYEYWDVRFVIKRKMMVSIKEVIDYIVTKFDVKGKITEKQIFSFYFWLKDEMQKIAEREIKHLTPKRKHKTNRIPSPREKLVPELMELRRLGNGNILEMEQIKRLKYAVVFDALLAETIEYESDFKKESK